MDTVVFYGYCVCCVQCLTGKVRAWVQWWCSRGAVRVKPLTGRS